VSLGLDLKGGMNVMLEVSVAELVNFLLQQTIPLLICRGDDNCRENQAASKSDFITLFAEAWDKVAQVKDSRRYSVLMNLETRSNLKQQMTK
jgi:SecD/SecF fusion protein